MRNYFEGYYYKHQKGNQTLCIIWGRAGSERFIQVITNDFSEKVPYTKGNIFSTEGIILNIHTSRLSLSGKIRYRELCPIKYDIMGPFKFFPMECRHGIVSMYHRLDGKIVLNGEEIDFTGGRGYIEKDSGHSFPSSYAWIQANDFSEPCSIMASVASVPFCCFHFQGCICVIQYRGKEYRLATYLGVRVISCTSKRILLKQGKYRLEIRIKNSNGHELSAPRNGKMERNILENPSCPAEFTFYIGEKVVFYLHSQHASYEYERQILRNLQ